MDDLSCDCSRMELKLGLEIMAFVLWLIQRCSLTRVLGALLWLPMLDHQIDYNFSLKIKHESSKAKCNKMGC